MTDRDFLFITMRQKYPDGKESKQREFCQTVAEERIEVYSRAFSEVTMDRSRKKFVVKA